MTFLEKTELFLDEPLHCAAITEALVVDYIDGFYNPVRRHSSIGYVSPIEWELQRAAPGCGGGAPAPRGGIKLHVRRLCEPRSRPIRELCRWKAWAAAPFMAALLFSSTGCGPGPQDPEVGTLVGSPLDRMPPEVTRLTDFGLRADWSPDGQRLVFLDALAGDVWEYQLETKALENLTAHFEHAGFSRVHHLSNGDLILCGPVERDLASDDPEEVRFDGVLWVLRRPFDGEPVPLEERCWEGIAVARNRLRIARHVSPSRGPSTRVTKRSPKDS